MTFALQIAGTVAVLLAVFVGIPAAFRAINRWAARSVQRELDAAQTMPLPWEPMPGHDPEPTTSYRRTPVDPKSWDAHCATALWNARADDAGGAA